MKFRLVFLLLLIISPALWGLDARDFLIFSSLDTIFKIFIESLGDGILSNVILGSLSEFFAGLFVGGSLAVFFLRVFKDKHQFDCKIAVNFAINLNKNDRFNLEFLALKREFICRLKPVVLAANIQSKQKEKKCP